jgi:hypothetical protein
VIKGSKYKSPAVLLRIRVSCATDKDALETPLAPLLRATPNCWICGKPVELKSCKFDERGKPVHEDCCVAKLAPDSRAPKFPSLPSACKTSA